MKRLVSPFLLVLIFSALSLGVRATPPERDPTDRLLYPQSMTLAGNRLFVSDAFSGLHVYDVTDFSAPTKVIRIPLDYNRGSAVKGDIVYTNDAEQLQAIRIDGDSYTVVAKIGVKYNYSDHGWYEGGGDSGYGCACSTTDYATAPTSNGGLGGGSSYATFALVDNELYHVDRSNLIVYDVTNNEKPARVSTANVGWDIETIHPTLNHLFIGGMNGMYIFDRVDPRHPKQIAQIQHARACDPVVVSGSTAYVTLRGNNGCGPVQNELLCVSIKDPSNPVVAGVKPMTTPYGLAVQNTRLYVSHGTNGYSLLDVSQPNSPAVEATWVGSTRDFIWSHDTLFVLEDANVAIYDVTDPLAPKFLSKVEPEVTP